MRAVIFANGLLTSWPDGIKISPRRDLIIAADGGLKHCKRLGITPHVVVGDMDSADPADLASAEEKGARIDRHPSRKDETDLWLAVRAALDKNPDEIIILGALGGRWDMTFANALILVAGELQTIEARILDGNQEIFVLQGGQRVRLLGQKGDLLSLMPLTEKVSGIVLSGFLYTLNNEDLSLGSTRGISNVFEGDSGQIELKTGKLLVTITHGPTR
ncbi:MAG: thiamine diphosphokinase [Deltaproteobacteria bacterium]|nr:thiamine diphosphokinase [Deltaproteobacteria bacterium]